MISAISSDVSIIYSDVSVSCSDVSAAVMYAPCIANCLLDINNLSGAQTILMVVTAHMEYFMSGIISC